MTQTTPDDEIDLLVLWSAIWRRRYVLGGLTLLGLAAGFAAGLRIQPVYESRAALQIGRVGGVGFVEEPVGILSQIMGSRTIPALRGPMPANRGGNVPEHPWRPARVRQRRADIFRMIETVESAQAI